MIGSGLFILPGLVFAQVGPAAILAYLLAGVSLIPSVLSNAELVTAMPKSGVIHHYTSRSLGPGFGTFGGFGAWFSLSLKTAFALFGMGIFILLFNPGFTEIQIKLVAIGFCLLFTVVNLVGIKFTSRVQNILVIIIIGLLAYYIISGFSHVQTGRYTPFLPKGAGSLLTAIGMVYVSFGGLTKVGAVAGEARNPGRNLPLALIISLILTMVLYVLVLAVTVGLVDSALLKDTLTPISLGASTYLGRAGSLLMGFIALVAFITMANTGILTASRDPMAMGQDRLLPRAFKRISKRGVPRFSVLFTSAFIIAAIMFLNLENLVKTASALILILFFFANLAVIAMRESKLDNYKPRFRSPLYPWMQIVGIIVSVAFISQMGRFPLILVGTFLILAFIWYSLYTRGHRKRDYALQHVFRRIRGSMNTSPFPDEGSDGNGDEKDDSPPVK